jgi:IS30 family transposase
MSRWTLKRAADLYAQGWTLREISAELGVHLNTVGEQLQRAGIIRRSGGPPHPASTQQIRELREQGLTWNEVAKQVDMTVPVPGAASGGPSHRSPHA